jgi:hypothetical protein
MLQEIESEEFISRNTMTRVEQGNSECLDYARGRVANGVVKVSEVTGLKDRISNAILKRSIALFQILQSERGDVPGWVLVVLMTTGLVTGIWTLAAPRIDSILRNSLDSMNGIR